MPKDREPIADYASSVTVLPLSPTLLEPLHEVNERCLELLAALAKLDASKVPFAMVAPVRSLLRGARGAVRRRAAHQPFSLVDMEFRDLGWWQAVRSNPARSWKDRPWRAVTPKRPAAQLAHTLLTSAWHMARADIDATALLYGMTPAVGQLVAQLRLSDIETIANHQCRHVRPRWEDRPAVWRKLLVAAHADDVDAMRAFTVYALQLMAGERIPRS